MTVRKNSSGKWLAEIYPNGADGKRIRRTFSTKGEALAFEAHELDEVDNKPWLGEKDDRRTLRDLVDSWFSRHGITLKDGEKRKSSMYHACECMREPLAKDFNANSFSSYREKRLKGDFARSSRVKKVSPRTLNLELAYFRAVFNELARLGDWKGDNPLKHVRPFKTDESEMAFLNKKQIDDLLCQCRKTSVPELEIVVKICLSTGARWSEAESLRASQITPYKITFTKTKGKKNRTIPISTDLFQQIPQKKGALFPVCYGAFRSALEKTDIDLPDGQLTHVLRHTFASHFMMNGGNILVLQRILGHTDIKMTMRYAHFSPDHFEDAVKLNPLA